MAEYKHGTYGNVNATGTKVSGKSKIALVYIGTAPVHTVENGAKNVNVPMLINDISEAKKYLGYSDDWASYTLCEAIHHNFETKGVGPLVFINVLDPTTHKSDESGNISLTPANGRIRIPSAGNIILDSVTVKTKESSATAKVKGKDYAISYNAEKETITIAELTSGALGTAELAITYDSVDPSKVTKEDVIGSTDDLGKNTGIYAVKNVYPLTKYIPAFLLCPGFSSIPEVHTALYQNSQKINGHWGAFIRADLPLTDKGTALTFDTVKTFKNANGYDRANEVVYFPMAQGTDGRIYHISVLAAANFQELLLEDEAEGIPYRTASNTECAIIERLYLGENDKDRVFDDDIINKKLNQYGIASAAYVGGRWAIWGAHTADYRFPENADSVNVAETNCMMLYWVCNDYQERRMPLVDKPLTPNDIKNIRSQEQTKLDGLTTSGKLAYGTVSVKSDAEAKSDIVNGDYCFTFNVTSTPISKSLAADVNWTEDGFVAYYADITAD